MAIRSLQPSSMTRTTQQASSRRRRGCRVNYTIEASFPRLRRSYTTRPHNAWQSIVSFLTQTHGEEQAVWMIDMCVGEDWKYTGLLIDAGDLKGMTELVINDGDLIKVFNIRKVKEGKIAHEKKRESDQAVMKDIGSLFDHTQTSPLPAMEQSSSTDIFTFSDFLTFPYEHEEEDTSIQSTESVHTPHASTKHFELTFREFLTERTDPLYHCDFELCNYKSYQWQELVRHFHDFHHAYGFTCPYPDCGIQFVAVRPYEEHIKHTHGSPRLPRRSIGYTPSSPVSSPESSPEPAELQESPVLVALPHVQTPDPPKPVMQDSVVILTPIATTGTPPTRGVKSVRKVKRKKRSRGPPQPYPICGCSCATSWTLQRHIINKHEGYKKD